MPERADGGSGVMLRELRDEAERLGRLPLSRDELIEGAYRVPGGVRTADDLHTDLAAVTDLLRRQAGEFRSHVHFQDVGTVRHIGDGVATLSGLPRVRTDELVGFATGVEGMVLNVDHYHLDVIMLGPDEGIRGGDLVTTTGERLRVPVGPGLLGRVVDALGDPLDEGGPVDAAGRHFVERDAPDIIERVPVRQPLHTGLKVVDALLPIGRGQRELIAGDRQTGKTAMAVDAILNQRHAGVPCVYVAIGQKKSSALEVIETLRRHGAMTYTIVVVSAPDDPPALRYLAPYAGCTMAEYLMHRQGRDVLIVYDDLSKHADAYRELSLLLRRPPGREAYPGDIFYLHARLLERACKLNDEAGGGSLTALPIVELQRGNVSAYIPTNLISINDGQIILDAGRFNRNVRPALDVGRSVSRVGGSAQTEAMRDVSENVRLELSQYEEVARFARFGAQVEEATRRQIERGRRLQGLLTQPVHQPLPLGEQIAVLFAATEGYIDAIPVDGMRAFEQGLLDHVRQEHSELLSRIERAGELEDDVRRDLHQVLGDFQPAWLEGRQNS